MIELQLGPQPWLERLYILREREEVLKFLGQYPTLFLTVLKASHKIEAYFPDAPLYLQIIHDPEEPVVQLLLSIDTQLEIDEGLEKLWQMEREWGLDVLRSVDYKLAIDIE